MSAEEAERLNREKRAREICYATDEDEDSDGDEEEEEEWIPGE